MTSVRRWTSADLANLPENGHRYEIIAGELFMSKQPHYHHQSTCAQAIRMLGNWSQQSKLGSTNFAPGIVFADDDDVVPDVTWTSYARLATALDEAGHMRIAPELAIEVLSPGRRNEARDRVAKLDLYSRRGVSEYWIISWQLRQVEIYRRPNNEADQLKLVGILRDNDKLETPLLPGFSCLVSDLFVDINQIPA